MKETKKYSTLAALMFCLVVATSMLAFADHGGNGQGSSTRDPLGALKRAITSASAVTLTTQQETDLTALITAYKDALPDTEDATLAAAKDAFDAAVLAGNQTAADTAAAQIAIRQSELSVARLKAFAKFEIAVLANLKTGGQYTALQTKFGDEKLLNLVGSMVGHGGR